MTTSERGVYQTGRVHLFQHSLSLADIRPPVASPSVCGGGSRGGLPPLPNVGALWV